jgi:hypothetical protein
MKQGIGRKLPLPCGCCSLRKWLVGGFSCRGVQNVGSGVRRRLEIEHDLQFPGEGIERTCNALTIEPVVFVKRRIEVWSVTEWSTQFFLAYGEITRSGRRGPYPHRPCAWSTVTPASAAVPVPHWPAHQRAG